MSIAPALAPSQLEQAIETAWCRLPHDLARQQVENAFRPALPSAVIELLLTTPRIERRLADRIAHKLGLVRPAAADFADTPARVLLAGRAAIETAIRYSGAIRHRGRIRPLVMRSQREEICAAIGADAFAAAQSCHATTPPPAEDWSTAQLIQSCLRDGPLCMANWIGVLPENIASWFLALVPSLAALDSPGQPDRDAIDAASLGAAAALLQGHG